MPVIHCAAGAGGGCDIIQMRRDAKGSLDYDTPVDNANRSLFDRFGSIKTMEWKKMSNGAAIHKYTYGQDANGHRARPADC